MYASDYNPYQFLENSNYSSSSGTQKAGRENNRSLLVNQLVNWAASSHEPKLRSNHIEPPPKLCYYWSAQQISILTEKQKNMLGLGLLNVNQR